MNQQASSSAVFISGCLAMLLFGIAFITLGSLAPALQKDLGIDALTFGTLFSLLPFGILLGSLIFGPFSDRYGYKLVLIGSCILLVGGFEGIAFSDNLTVLRISIFIFGSGGGILNGASNASVADMSTSKAANLSLLGVFFSIGALGMPILVGMMQHQYSYQTILSLIGLLPIGVAVVFAFTTFPSPKQVREIPFRQGADLLKEDLIFLIGIFLACQSSFEGIINNWTTTYLADQFPGESTRGLYALSMYVVGMAAMRLAIGSVLRAVSPSRILMISFLFLLTGSILLHASVNYPLVITGLILLGAGLAGGFPIMLGFVSSRYASLSATAFSVVIGMALLGNMLVNYLLGVVAHHFGIQHLTTFAFTLTALMIILSINVFLKLRLKPV
jgi:MFS transporter, FHS family, glucose/mannose:H+ symporter